VTGEDEEETMVAEMDEKLRGELGWISEWGSSSVVVVGVVPGLGEGFM
jgi:hypothetical protein